MEAFESVDELYVTDVYAASEDMIEGINSEAFVNEFREKSDIPCKYVGGSISDVAKVIYSDLKKDDIVIGLGAGTITKLGKELLALNEERVKVGN